MKRTLAAIALTIGLVATPVATATSASAATNLGGVSIWNACVHQNGQPSSVVLVANNVMGWRCKYDGGWNAIYMGVSVDRECKRVFGSRAYSGYLNFGNPYSWRCFR